ncbi:MAG: OB-fold domain-containing protein [Actinomycetospora chiangmaiensis]|nr:OB-fold domain-containing protein [Actinomycetospora chiangmaiensis]
MTGGPEDTATVADWTRGGAGLRYTRCRGCGGVEYFARPFCPRCGGEDLDVRAASGRGTVYALTRVSRAPSPEWSAHAPYGIALVDAPEGFRFMAHAAEGLAIGDPVTVGFRRFGTGLVPFVASGDRPEGPKS